MNEMALGAEQINAAVGRVTEISRRNREDIALLLKEVSRFKVE
jgi:methyl-accepting chemotaxis protein